MKFTKLRITGFKSFVEPSEFLIEPGLTGVVGPNGCGKSNLTESLRWVMGENSYKNMRASGMDDVIFSGSGGRPSRNVAEVVLTIDNQQKLAPAMFNAADVLEISRRIERDEGSRPRANPSAESATAAAMRLCRRIDEAVAQGRYSSYAAAGRAEGLRKGVLSKYRLLGRLSEQEQRDVLEGKAAGCSLAKLIEVASIESREQRSQAFAALVTASAAKRRRTPAATSNAQPSSTPSPEPPAPAPVRVRVAVYFNPERFVEQRLHARRLRKRIDTFVAELNASLQAPRSQHTKQSIAGAVDRRLRADSLLQTFKLNVAERSVDGRTRYHVRLELDEAEWARRARYDGFTVLVAHPELSQSANELCELYRAKDAVEKDFQSIKSVVQLRPVRHRDDGKVRAHVTLCMLSLLLERTLKHRLADHSTAVAALECLKTCHLNRYAGRDGSSAYIVTEPDAEQSAILRKLNVHNRVQAILCAGDIDFAAYLRR